MDARELYLIRHGIAAERGPEFPDDTRRPLTAEGIARLKAEARGLDLLGVRVDLILTSPLVRTVQTAEVFARYLAGKPTIVRVDALAPDGTAAAVVGELANHKAGRIALVGHEPNIGELAAHLIAARHPVPFKKGAVCRIDVGALPPKGAGQLIWFAPPRLLRRLAADRH